MLYRGNTSSLSSSALLWGRNNENNARVKYGEQLGVGWSVQDCGLFVSIINGFLAATPDGLVCNDGKIEGCLEIKCPFSARDKSIHEACSVSQFFCKTDNKGTITLKQSHNYFYQIQGQLAVLNLKWCDFVVWTTKDLHIERVHFDEVFWNRQCLPKLTKFYYNIMLPELIYSRRPMGHEIIQYTFK